MRLVGPLVVVGLLSLSSLAVAQAPAPAASGAPPAASSSSAPAAPPPPSGPGPVASSAAPEPPPPADLVAPPPVSVKPEGENPYFPVQTRRRYGFTLGLSGGAQVTNAQGSSIKFTQRANRTSTGFAVGTGESIWLGGVFTDWFAFHIGMTFGSATKGDHEISGSGVLFGVETWPLFAKGGVFRDLGLGLDFGTGSGEVRNKALDKLEANGGSLSMIRGSVFWDAASLWKINVGPFVGYERRDGEVFSQNIFWLGLRTAFYGVNVR